MRDALAALRAGALAVRRAWPVLAGVYALDLALAAAVARPFQTRVADVLDHSLGAAPLARSNDVYVLAELLGKTELGGRGVASPAELGHSSALVLGSLWAGGLFFAAMLLLGGGIVARYRSDAPLGAAGFFRACGASWARFARLFLWSLVALVPLFLLARWMEERALVWFDAAPRERLGFYVLVGLGPAVLLALGVVRLAVDLAQARAVAEDEDATGLTLLRALALLRRRFRTLLAIQLVTSLAAAAGVALLATLWARLVPAASVGLAFAAGQAIALYALAVRLWQRAAVVRAYEAMRSTTATATPRREGSTPPPPPPSTPPAESTPPIAA